MESGWGRKGVAGEAALSRRLRPGVGGGVRGLACDLGSHSLLWAGWAQKF